jgi:hypothetical protein
MGSGIEVLTGHKRCSRRLPLQCQGKNARRDLFLQILVKERLANHCLTLSASYLKVSERRMEASLELKQIFPPSSFQTKVGGTGDLEALVAGGRENRIHRT